MGLLQGPRLMAQTTKSPIWRNHWVPVGCRGHLGSVNTDNAYMFYDNLVETQEYKNSPPDMILFHCASSWTWKFMPNENV